MPIEALFSFALLLSLHCLSFFRASRWLYLLSSALAVFMVLRSGHWLESSGFFSFTSSSFRIFFGSIVAGLGFLVGLYSMSYMKDSPYQRRFYGLLGLFQWSCLLICFANHSLLFVSGWELSSIIGFLLISFKSENPKALRGAYQALIITGTGGLCLLGAMVLISEEAGSYLLTHLLSPDSGLAGSRAYEIARFLIAAAILTKSAQFPFHFWLPGAMLAPSPVSAYLHSATLVQLGVFAAGLFWPLFRHDTLWHVGLSGIGFVTFAWGAFFSIFKYDLKAGLAHTTFSQLGLILVFFSQRHELSFQIACLLMLAHALYKFVLFLGVGAIAKIDASQDIREVGPWLRRSKLLLLAMGISCGSMAGLPLFLGFAGKELVLERLLTGNFASESARFFSLSLFSLGSFFTIVFAFIFFSQIFLKKKKKQESERPEKLGFGISFALILPALFSVLLSYRPQVFTSFLTSIQSSLEAINIHVLPHQINSSLVISIALIAGGLIASVFILRWPAFWSRSGIHWGNKLQLSWIFQSFLFEQLARFNRRMNRGFESAFWKKGLGIVVILFSALLLGMAPLQNFSFASTHFLNTVHMDFSLSVFASGLLALLLYFFPRSFIRIFILGVIGYLVAFSFALFGAPDLVLTQLIVESCSLALLVLAWINIRREFQVEAQAPWAWGLAFAFGFIVLAAFQESTFLVQTKMASLYYFEKTGLIAHGQNMVNVILVDFRGLDTLGEISVLAIAYFGAASLYERYSVRQKLLTYPLSTNWMRKMGSLLSIGLFVFGLFFLVRGHNFPGGGFIGGLLFALAFFLRMIFFAIRPPAKIWVLSGLAIAYFTALITGLGSYYFEALSFGFLSTSLAFDTGVLITVAGSLSGMLEILLKLRGERWQLLKGKENV